MKLACFVCLFFCSITSLMLSQSNPVSVIGTVQADPKAQARVLEQYGKLPLSFEANRGQVDSRVKFFSRMSGYSLFLTADEAVLTLRGGAKRPAPKGAARLDALPVSLKRYPDTNLAAGPTAERATNGKMTGGKVTTAVLRMKLHNANTAAKVSGLDEMAGTSNYFIGNDPGKWRTNVPTYAKVKYEGIYSGIDLVYYGNQRQLEYDFIVAPGADPRRISFDVRGTKRILRDAQGDLVFKVGDDEIRWHKPVVYQEKDGARLKIAAHYAITDTNRLGFELAKYDVSRPLYIDPLVYSTYLGGSWVDVGYGIAVDSAGNAYITGYTSSTNFPTMNPLQPRYGGDDDAFVTKINPAGSALVYSTYLGGSKSDSGSGVAVDSAGNAYVTGVTESNDYPTTPGAFQTVCGGGSCGSGNADAFVAEISPTGSALVYSTYLGGSGRDAATHIAVDSAGNAHVAGLTCSTDFPITLGAFQTTYGGGGCDEGDAFVINLNSAGSALVYSTYLGGSGSDYAYSIAVDSTGNAYVTGVTGSTNFPTTAGAFQTAYNGSGVYGSDAFVTKLNPTGRALVYSTYLGGSGENGGLGIALDTAGNAYVVGLTSATDFPTMNPLQPTYGGGPYDAFLAKFNPTGLALVYSTYLGGSGDDRGLGIALDNAGTAYVIGGTDSSNFPVTNGAFQTKCKSCSVGSSNAFMSKLDPTGSALVYSTYLGGRGRQVEQQGTGIAADSAGKAYATGYTYATNFPVTPGAFQTNFGGASDAFVTKIDTRAATTTALTSSPNPSTYGEAVTFNAVVTSSAGAPPDGETVSFMKGTKILGTGTLSGGSASFTTSTLKVGTNYIKAVYGGDSNFAGSKSKVVAQVVN